MTEKSTLLKEPKQTIEIDEGVSSINGNGLWHDLNLFWRIIKRFRWWFVALFIVVFVVSFSYFNYSVSYSATAKFTITDWSQAFPSANNSIYNPDRVNQMLMLFLSDSVVQFLIDKYGMASQLKHPDDISEQEELQSDIASSIILEPSVFNSFDLKVKSPDRFLSAGMANDIISKVKEISSQLYARDLANRIEVLKNLLTTVTDSDSASRHFAIIQAQLNELTSNRLSSDELKAIMNELGALEKQYDDRLVQLKLNELMFKQISSSGTSSITLIQKAIPDFTNYFFIWLIYALLIAAFVCSMLPVVIYLISRVGERKWMQRGF